MTDDSNTDPTGRQASEPGAKLDAGKNRLGLVIGGFANALQAVGAVGTFGANKYTDNGWREVPDGVERYTDALYRHLLADHAGETNDGESGILHAAHAAWNALAVLELKLAGGVYAHTLPNPVTADQISDVGGGGQIKYVVDRLSSAGYEANTALAEKLWERFSADQCASFIEITHPCRPGDGINHEALDRFVDYIDSGMRSDEAFS